MKSPRLFSAFLTLCVLASPSVAERTQPNTSGNSRLKLVCPASTIKQIGKEFFYKNNKPIREGIDGPVIGNNPVITLAGQPFIGPRIFQNPGTLYDINGTRITTLTPFPCKSDHCTGRVVSSTSTNALRRAALKTSKSPAGYIKVGRICVYIPDIGRCYGNNVNMTRPLCDRTLR